MYIDPGNTEKEENKRRESVERETAKERTRRKSDETGPCLVLLLSRPNGLIIP